MIEFFSLTILDQVRIATPFIFGTLCFSLFTWLLCYITEVRVNRKWLRDPANMERTVQDHLKRKEDTINQFKKENAVLKAENEKMKVVIQGVQNRVLVEGKPVIQRRAE